MAFAVPQLALLTGGIASFVICLCIVLTKRWHGAHTLDTEDGVQKIHQQPTPRVGGVAVFIALLLSWALTPPIVADVLGPMLLAAVPAFLAGSLEDLLKRGRVGERLFATFASGVLAWWLTGVSVTNVGIWGLDSLLVWTPVSVLFTAFAVGGLANSINIIDGFNGLAGGVVLVCLSALGLMSYQVFDYEMAKLCFVLAGAIFGFMILNYPFGKIFLGDGGAYLLGFLLGWVAVMVAERNPTISPWAPLLACGYPILEVLFSMARRRARKLRLGHPDRLHLHSLLWARLARPQLHRYSVITKNAVVMPLILCFAVVPAICSVVYKANTLALGLSFLGSALLYSLIYVRLVHFRWAWPTFALTKRKVK